MSTKSAPQKPQLGETKPAGRTLRWLRQVAQDHISLRKPALTYAIWLTRYLGATGIAYFDQTRESRELNTSDRHLRRGRSDLLQRGHLEEAGRNRAGNVFDRIVMRPDHCSPPQWSGGPV